MVIEIAPLGDEQLAGHRQLFGRPELFRLAEVNFVDDNVGKPVGINEFIGRRPILAFGNSDGDLEMLQWTTMSGGSRLLHDRLPRGNSSSGCADRKVERG
jgi:hypothetical protein